MATNFIPWSFLDVQSTVRQEEQTKVPPSRKTFAQALGQTCDINTSQLPQPCIKGDAVAIKIPEAEYQAGLNRCKTHLHGRIVLSKGDSPMKFLDLKAKLCAMWNMIGKWNMLSLGKGFYEFSFSSLEDMRTVCSTGTWSLKPGILRLFLWTPDFNPNLQKQTHSQSWIRILGLPQEYWSPRILFSIAGGIGTPISLDSATSNRTFGHYAKVLVEINLLGDLPEQILVEREGFAFFVGIEYENLPGICTGCNAIGHTVSQCRKIGKKPVNEEPALPKDKSHMAKNQAEEAPRYRAKKNPLPDTVPHLVEVQATNNVTESRQINDLVINLELDREEGNLPELENLALNNAIGEVESDYDDLPNENVIVQETSDMNNKAAYEDMRIVGRLWGDDNDSIEGEEDFQAVLSKGFGNQKTKIYLKNLCLSNKPDFVMIAEPKIPNLRVSDRYWKELNLMLLVVNDRGEDLPSLWVLCNPDLAPSVLVKADQHIALSMLVNNKIIYICAIYAQTNHILRRSLWFHVQKLIADLPGPWCCIGDFNVVLGAHECRSLRLPARTPCAEFQAFIDHAGLMSLPTSGAQYTWSNRRIGSASTEKRLDRALINEDWLNSFNNTTCSTLPRLVSDHHSNYQVQPRQSSFKFHKMWLLNSDCRRLVAEVWGIQVLGCPMYVLSQKLRNLKKELIIWNQNVFGNIHQIVNSAKANVDAIQDSINDHGPDSNLLEQENLAQSELLLALEVEEAFWKEKAKINWHSMGDRNTSFFHRITKIRQGTKSLSMLKNGDSILTSKDDIENHVLDYYTNLFASHNSTVPNSLIQEVIPRLVTDSDNSMLTSMPSLAEIKSAVFALNEEGAPGPDGFSGCFYQNFWDIINIEVCNAVMQFFKHSWLMPNINSNSVILIPKTHGADRIEDYRPIALANFQFKIITKVLADRLADIAPRIISNQQRGFIKERQIKDCICLTSEAINMLDHKAFGSSNQYAGPKGFWEQFSYQT
ncbi:PREDICTED: uncharacterized protein LOC109342412 [Lupinus angustifolius]|uniref:uncharacterized protein LOC109342412 n=1 Tax=Lupinus angustifolius TaxID=3871 RepID=UPI00092F1682|nr:PREDICTED: uncharacterized protein LOC109342412 [Lupinus angustifolius]